MKVGDDEVIGVGAKHVRLDYYMYGRRGMWKGMYNWLKNHF
jgi:hypothetical protein